LRHGRAAIAAPHGAGWRDPRSRRAGASGRGRHRRTAPPRRRPQPYMSSAIMRTGGPMSASAACTSRRLSTVGTRCDRRPRTANDQVRRKGGADCWAGREADKTCQATGPSGSRGAACGKTAGGVGVDVGRSRKLAGSARA
jgi:hypothetical protein